MTIEPLTAEEIAEGRELLLAYERAGHTWGTEYALGLYFIDHADALLAAAERVADHEGLRQEARAHLAAALAQVAPSDDEIIIGHLRKAHNLLVRMSVGNSQERGMTGAK